MDEPVCVMKPSPNSGPMIKDMVAIATVPKKNMNK